MTALASLLEALPGVTAERNRLDEFPIEKSPALNLIEGNQTADHGVHGITSYVVNATVEGFVTAEDSAAAATALNVLYGLVAAICGPTQTLGGLAFRVDEKRLSVDLDHGNSERAQAAFALEIKIEFITAAGDPYTLGPA